MTPRRRRTCPDAKTARHSRHSGSASRAHLNLWLSLPRRDIALFMVLSMTAGRRAQHPARDALTRRRVPPSETARWKNRAVGVGREINLRRSAPFWGKISCAELCVTIRHAKSNTVRQKVHVQVRDLAPVPVSNVAERFIPEVPHDDPHDRRGFARLPFHLQPSRVFPSPERRHLSRREHPP